MRREHIQLRRRTAVTNQRAVRHECGNSRKFALRNTEQHDIRSGDLLAPANRADNELEFRASQRAGKTLPGASISNNADATVLHHVCV